MTLGEELDEESTELLKVWMKVGCKNVRETLFRFLNTSKSHCIVMSAMVQLFEQNI